MMRNIDVDFDDSINVTEYNAGAGYTFTIPSTPNFRGSRYVIRLPEIPYLKDPTKLPTITGMVRIEGAQPNTSEFRTVDVEDSDIRIAPHMVEFNAAQAGTTQTIYFWSFGSIVDVELPNTNSTVTVGKGKPFLDYVCNGVNDTAQIQAAIDYVNSIGGGEVKILEGTYNITTTIEMKNSVKLIGCGVSTVLKRMVDTFDIMINYDSSVYYAEVSNFYIAGNGTVIPIISTFFALKHDYIGQIISTNKCTNLLFVDFSTNLNIDCYGIYGFFNINNIDMTLNIGYNFYGIYANYSTINNCNIYSNTASNNFYGIYASYSTVKDCNIYSNTATTTFYGIRASYSTVKDCEIYSNTSSSFYGIYDTNGIIKNNDIYSNSANYYICLIYGNSSIIESNRIITNMNTRSTPNLIEGIINASTALTNSGKTTDNYISYLSSTSGSALGFSSAVNCKNNICENLIYGTNGASYSYCKKGLYLTETYTVPTVTMSILTTSLGGISSTEIKFYSTQHNLKTGDILYFSSVSNGMPFILPNEITAYRSYYVIYDTNNTFFLANSYINAHNLVLISSTGSGGWTGATSWNLYTLPTNI
jgi:parallel beta-helix repeat protein